MFTGLIESVGTVVSMQPGSGSVLFTIDPKSTAFDSKLGDSIAVNGVCLTVESYVGTHPQLRAVTETLKLTALGKLTVGSSVNLERAMIAGARLDGHIVQGHVDTVGTITKIEQSGDSYYYYFSVESSFEKYLALKGSIAIDGISLTIAKSFDGGFAVALIPHTIKETTLKHYTVGSSVNLECDVLARYIEKLLYSKEKDTAPTKSGPSLMELLERNDY